MVMFNPLGNRWKPAVMACVILGLVLFTVWSRNKPQAPQVDLSPVPPAGQTVTPTQQAAVPELTDTHPAITSAPAPALDSPHITPPPSNDLADFMRESISPDGRWKAHYSSTHLEDGRRHLLLQLFRLEEVWNLVWTILDETGIDIDSSELVMQGWDKGGSYFFFSPQPVLSKCQIFDNASTSWRRLDLETGQVDDFPLPSGYEHALSPSGGSLAYITHDPELALVIHDLGKQVDTLIALPVEILGPGEKSAGGIAWASNSLNLVLTVSSGDLCNEPLSSALLRINLFPERVNLVEMYDRLVVALVWHPSGKILLEDSDGYTWWIGAASGNITSAPSHTPTPTPVRSLTEEEIYALVIAQEPVVRESLPSPDGIWQAEVIAYPCLETGEYQENALEKLVLRRVDGQEERILDEQLLNCGGIGAWGLGNLVWSSDSGYLYYSTGREGVPGGIGICLWEHPLTRLEVQTGDRIQLSYGPSSPDGEQWVMRQGQELIVWDHDEGEIGRVASPYEGTYFLVVAWMTNGQELVYILGRETCFPYYAQYLGTVDLTTQQHSLLVEGTLEDNFIIVQNGQGILYRTLENHEFPHGKQTLNYLEYQTRKSQQLAEASLYIGYRMLEGRRKIVYWVEDTTVEYPQGFYRLVHLNLDNMQEQILFETAGSLSFDISLKLDVLVYLEKEDKGHDPGVYTLHKVDLVSFLQTPVLQGEGTADFSFSPDGSSLAVLEVEWDRSSEWNPFEISNSRLSIVDLSTGQVSELLNSSDPVFEYMGWLDNDTLTLGWEGWRYRISTGELWME
jgi:hypothetical protein